MSIKEELKDVIALLLYGCCFAVVLGYLIGTATSGCSEVYRKQHISGNTIDWR